MYRDVFGGKGFSLRWLLPLDPQFQDWEALCGYTLAAPGKDGENETEQLV